MICTWNNLVCRWNSRGLVRVCWALPLLLFGCGPDPSALGQEGEAPAPSSAVLYTATGDVRALASWPDGRLWAATGGGVLCWTPDGTMARRWTTADGLDSNDVRAVAADGDGLCVTTALGQDRIDGAGIVTRDPGPAGAAERTLGGGPQAWAVTDAGPVRRADGRRFGWPDGEAGATVGGVTGLAADGQGFVLATSLGLWRWAAGRWHVLPLPPGSSASHVSALTNGPGGLLAGLYGDGVYRLSPSGRWRRLPGQPAACRFPTALARTADGGLAVGTGAAGVWRERGGAWQECAMPPSLPGADVGCLAAYRGALWAGTFDGGLLRLTGGGGEKVRAFTQADGLRSASPRGLAVFRGALYARGADGQLDASADGAVWRPAFPRTDLPRPEVYALVAQGDRRLLLGGWAGWAATDGKRWERHEHDAELRGQVVTAIAAQGDTVWIGTQKRGLLRFQDGRYTAYQEAQGLTDDWITCLAVRGGRLLVGTYTGGLLEKTLEKTGERLAVRLQPGAFAVRSLAFDPADGCGLAATPLGLYREDAPGRWRLVAPRRTGGPETQAVLPGPGGAWVASRAGLAFVPRRDLQPRSAGDAVQPFHRVIRQPQTGTDGLAHGLPQKS